MSPPTPSRPFLSRSRESKARGEPPAHVVRELAELLRSPASSGSLAELAALCEGVREGFVEGVVEAPQLCLCEGLRPQFGELGHGAPDVRVSVDDLGDGRALRGLRTIACDPASMHGVVVRRRPGQLLEQSVEQREAAVVRRVDGVEDGRPGAVRRAAPDEQLLPAEGEEVLEHEGVTGADGGLHSPPNSTSHAAWLEGALRVALYARSRQAIHHVAPRGTARRVRMSSSRNDMQLPRDFATPSSDRDATQQSAPTPKESGVVPRLPRRDTPLVPTQLPPEARSRATLTLLTGMNAGHSVTIGPTGIRRRARRRR